MTSLVFGVDDLPYRYQQATGSGKRKRVIVLSSTTKEVAEHLEEKYHLFKTFFEHEQDFEADELAKSVEGAIESLFAGAPAHSLNPFGSAGANIAARFKEYLYMEKFRGLILGVPTAASGKTDKRKGGVNHRLAHPYSSKNPPRPSFIDTGTFESSIQVWVE